METSNKYQDIWNRVVASLLSLEKLENNVCQSQPDERFLEMLHQWAQGTFNLVVMGEAKQGKSSIINAILGIRDLVPVHAQIATSTIYKISYGKELSYRVIFTEESGKAPLEIKLDQVHEFGTEAGNPRNEKQVNHIRVQVPSPILEHGLEITDTPGLGGMVAYHKEVTYRCLGKADAVLFITDSTTAPIGSQAVTVLKDLLQVTQDIFFVQTKSCAVSCSAAEEMHQRNAATLTDPALIGIPGESLSYFVVDSLTKWEADEANDADLLADSGYAPLMEFITKTLPERKLGILFRRAMLMSGAKMRNVQEKIRTESTIWEESEPANLKKMQEELLRLKQEFLQWSKKKVPQFRSELKREISNMFQKMTEPLEDMVPNGMFHLQLQTEIQNISSKDDFDTMNNDLSDVIKAEFTRRAVQCESIMKREGDRLYEKIAQMAGQTEDHASNTHAASLDSIPADHFTAKGTKTIDLMRHGFFGKSAGAIAGALIGSVIPVIGTAIGAIAGAIIGLFTGFGSARKEALERNKNALISCMAQSIASCYSRINAALSKSKTDCSFDIDECITNAIQARSDEFDSQINSLAEKMKANQATIADKLRTITAWNKQLTNIVTFLSSVKASL